MIRHAVCFGGLFCVLACGAALALEPLLQYQGRLTSAATGEPADGPVQITFALYAEAEAGASLWSETKTVNVVDGLFSTTLGDAEPLDAAIFDGQALWLGIAFEAEPEATPRQRLVPGAYALHAGSAAALEGFVASDFAQTGDVYTKTEIDGQLADQDALIDALATLKADVGHTHDASDIDSGILDEARIPASIARTADVWRLGGNGLAATGVLGASTNQALELHVNGARVLRLEPRDASPNVLGGYHGNLITQFVAGAAIGGGGSVDNLNRVTDNFGTVGGGRNNQAGDGAGAVADRSYATVGGGRGNTASGLAATVAGGRDNTARGFWSTACGGFGNDVAGQYSTVGGGRLNTTDSSHATVGGGQENAATNDYAMIGGGLQNEASGTRSTIAGGQNNAASNSHATVAGGLDNSASGFIAAVGGGNRNVATFSYATVGGGVDNEASGEAATIAGGNLNVASGFRGIIPGGDRNTAAGAYSFAAGRRAKANHDGSFVWASSLDSDVASPGVDTFSVRAAGLWFGFSSAPTIPSNRFIHTSTGAGLSLTGQWLNLSDRNAKKGFAPVDTADVLEKVASLPVTEWSYKIDAPGVRHIGPMAQDFHATFGLGGDDVSISAVDAGGVALAAIQGLNRKLETENAALRGQLAELLARVETLEMANAAE